MLDDSMLSAWLKRHCGLRLDGRCCRQRRSGIKFRTGAGRCRQGIGHFRSGRLWLRGERLLRQGLRRKGRWLGLPGAPPADQDAGANQGSRDPGAVGAVFRLWCFLHGLGAQQGRRCRMLTLLFGFSERIEDVRHGYDSPGADFACCGDSLLSLGADASDAPIKWTRVLGPTLPSASRPRAC